MKYRDAFDLQLNTNYVNMYYANIYSINRE